MVRLLHYSDVENAYDDPERIGRLAGCLQQLVGDDGIITGTGDNTGPGALALATRGEQSLAFFDRVQPDVETFGNHDFDYGPERALELARRSPQQWVSANVFDDDGRFGASDGVLPTTVVERDGVRVGFVGVTDPNTKAMCPTAVGLRFEDPLPAIREGLSTLEREGVDHRVVCSHVGRGDAEIARRTDADAVLGGHVHEERVQWVGDVPCTRPGANGAVVIEVDLDEDRVDRQVVTDFPCDEVVTTAMDDLADANGLDEVVTAVPSPIPREREALRAGETRIGNLVADAYRWAADADVGLQNTGGIRAGPPLEGDVTMADVIGLVPFDEPVAVAELEGERLARVLAEGDGTRLPEVGDYWHAHVSGATVIRGEEVTARVKCEPIDPDRTYTLATTNYLFHSPFEFPSLREEDRVARLDRQYEVIAAYGRAAGFDPRCEGRIRSE